MLRHTYALCLCRPESTTDLAITLVLSSVATWHLAATLPSLFGMPLKFSSWSSSLLLSSQLQAAADLITVLNIADPTKAEAQHNQLLMTDKITVTTTNLRLHMRKINCN